MSLLKFTFIYFILLLPISATATVDYLAANNLTKGYYWEDEDHSTGWIGWTYIPESQLETAEVDLIKLDYTETFYPYKIETCLLLIITLLILGVFLSNRKLWRRQIDTGSHFKIPHVQNARGSGNGYCRFFQIWGCVLV